MPDFGQIQKFFVVHMCTFLLEIELFSAEDTLKIAIRTRFSLWDNKFWRLSRGGGGGGVSESTDRRGVPFWLLKWYPKI